MNWVRLPKYLKETGETRSMFYKLKDEGHFYEGIHYQYDKAKRVWVNIKAMEAWLMGKRAQPSSR